jgi:hypothetical protein
MRSLLRLVPISLLFCSMACSRQGAGSGSNFARLVTKSVQELEVKNKANLAWGQGTFDRWDLDQEAGTLVFSRKDGTRATCWVQIVGSFDVEKKTWHWSWDNPSVAAALTVDACLLRELGTKNKIKKLTEANWEAEESDAWDMTALAVRMGEAEGAFSGPSGHREIFMTFGDVTISKRH